MAHKTTLTDLTESVMVKMTPRLKTQLEVLKLTKGIAVSGRVSLNSVAIALIELGLQELGRNRPSPVVVRVRVEGEDYFLQPDGMWRRDAKKAAVFASIPAAETGLKYAKKLGFIDTLMAAYIKVTD